MCPVSLTAAQQTNSLQRAGLVHVLMTDDQVRYAAQCNAAQHSVEHIVQCSVCGAVLHCTVLHTQHRTAQRSAVLHSAVQCCVVLCGTALHDTVIVL